MVWAYTWFDPAKEADAAKALIEQGVDVILAHTDSTAPLAEAAKIGGAVIGFGQASDMAEYKPSPRVSSIVDNWAPYYVKRVQAVLDGTWEGQDTWEGIGGGEVGIGEITDAVPAEVKAEAEAMRDAIGAGTYHPFTGPLNKQDGTRLAGSGRGCRRRHPGGDELLRRRHHRRHSAISAAAIGAAATGPERPRASGAATGRPQRPRPGGAFSAGSAGSPRHSSGSRSFAVTRPTSAF